MRRRSRTRSATGLPRVTATGARSRHVATGLWARLRAVSLTDRQPVTTILSLLSLLVAVLSLLQGSASEPATSGVSASGTGDPPPGSTGGVTPTGSPTAMTYPSKIVNTYSDEQRKFLGVRASVSPYARGDAGVGYLEGMPVQVVCQARDGRLVSDNVSGREFTSTVWYRTTDNVWISAIYSDLPVNGEHRPPPC